MPEVRCAAIILAAGASTRLGQPKQLLRIGEESLIRRTLRLAGEAGFTPVYVVLGAHAEGVRRELAGTEAIPVENSRWREGMGASLGCGVRAASQASPEHLLLLVCDQPKLTSAMLAEMRALHLAQQAPVTAARYAGRLGVPAIFARRCFPDLLEIKGDRGAREVLARYATEAASIPFHEGDCDIDAPDDLIHLKE